MTADQRGLLLRFVTSVSRAPLGGFRHLNPPLTVHKARCMDWGLRVPLSRGKRLTCVPAPGVFVLVGRLALQQVLTSALFEGFACLGEVI